MPSRSAWFMSRRFRVCHVFAVSTSSHQLAVAPPAAEAKPRSLSACSTPYSNAHAWESAPTSLFRLVTVVQPPYGLVGPPEMSPVGQLATVLPGSAVLMYSWPPLESPLAQVYSAARHGLG